MSGVKRTTDNPITPRTTKKPNVSATPAAIVMESTKSVREIEEILNEFDWANHEETRMNLIKVKENHERWAGIDVGMNYSPYRSQ